MIYPHNRQRPVLIWLYTGLVMIMIQIVLGGITRLTGSGLSITEWDIVTGAVPPLNTAKWMEEFEKYRQTEQFRQLNYGFTLADFKFIYFWEWLHRLWGRLIGVVFIIPFLVFLFQRRFRADMIMPLIILFILGALQGVVGWIMVASGLTGDAVYVRPTRLALHFTLALVLLYYLYWFIMRLRFGRNDLVFNTGIRNFSMVIIVILFVQFFWGALMAGHKAAVVSNTWPDMNGYFIPPVVLRMPGGMASFIENPVTVHFLHRVIAYIIVVLVMIWTFSSLRIRASEAFSRARFFPLLFVLIQAALGIFTVITSTGIRAYQWNIFEWMAQLHQVFAMFLLLSMAHVLYLSRRSKYS